MKHTEQRREKKVIQTNLDVDRRVGILYLCLILSLLRVPAVVRHYWFQGDVFMRYVKRRCVWAMRVNSKCSNNEMQEQEEIVQALYEGLFQCVALRSSL